MADSPLVTLVADFAAASDFEKKHTPYMTLEQRGHEVPHPNGTDHFISFIEIYAGMAPVARFDFAPAVAWPRTCVPVTLPAGTVLRAVAHCNLHGWWAYEVTL
jgi:superoxide reductase